MGTTTPNVHVWLVSLVILVHVNQTTVVARESHCLQVQSVRARLATDSVQQRVSAKGLAAVEEDLDAVLGRLWSNNALDNTLAEQEARAVALHLVREVADDLAVAEGQDLQASIGQHGSVSKRMHQATRLQCTGETHVWPAVHHRDRVAGHDVDHGGVLHADDAGAHDDERARQLVHVAAEDLVAVDDELAIDGHARVVRGARAAGDEELVGLQTCERVEVAPAAAAAAGGGVGLVAHDRDLVLALEAREARHDVHARGLELRAHDVLLGAHDALHAVQDVVDRDGLHAVGLAVEAVVARRIVQLGGADYARSQPQAYDADGSAVAGVGGYKYFGAAKNLPGVRELFQKEEQEPRKRSRQDMYKHIEPDYYGFRDDEDEQQLKDEAAAEERLKQRAMDGWDAAEAKRKAQVTELVRAPEAIVETARHWNASVLTITCVCLLLRSPGDTDRLKRLKRLQ
ncbi:unnamed protein product [Phytophthora fragariaefolia]|uniref:Unnamed protein product n=1 Tax=Phytophthora fragariaefolia TaxID=1490495 RepID=A0A9W6XJD5_9STRA|nr:unnamed protein product [Phytophthora fragariaefolia]